MLFYDVVLRLMGYSLYLDKSSGNADNPIELQTSGNNILPVFVNNDVAQLASKKQRAILVLKYMYNAIIFSLIAWSFVYSLIISIKTRDVNYTGGCLFQLIFSVQYIVGIWLFNHDYFYKKIQSCKSMEKHLSIILPISVIIGTMLSISVALITFLNAQINETSITNIFRSNSSPVLIFVVLIDKFFSYGSFLMNVSVFVVLMFHHQNEIIQYSHKIKEYMISSVPLSTKVSTISIELVRMNDELGETIQKLTWFFTSLNVIGLSSMFFITRTFSNDGVNSIDMFNLILFLLIEYVYISFAQKTRKSIDAINSNIALPVYINNYMHRESAEIVIPDMSTFDQQKSFQAIVQNQIYLVGLSESVAWIQLQKILELEWGTFEIFGIQIKDTSLVQKIIGVIITVLIASDIVNVISF